MMAVIGLKLSTSARVHTKVSDVAEHVYFVYHVTRDLQESPSPSG